MKLYFPKVAGAVTMLALFATTSFAQDDKDKKESTTVKKSEDVIVITPKTKADTKLTIEIKGDDIKVNGKPLSEYKDDDISISRRKHYDLDVMNRDMDVLRAPGTRFRSSGGATVFGMGDDNLAWSGSSNKAFLGVGSEKDKEGASITSISKGSGAEKAGLKEDDIITKLDDTKISSPDDLTKTIGKYKPDDKVTVTYLRDKKEMKTTATLGKRKTTMSLNYAPEAYKNFNFDNDGNYHYFFNGKARLGLKAQETEDGKGLKVLDVDDESTAEKAGIKEGDIITSFDGTEVNSVEKLGELAKAALEKNNFKIKLTRDGKAQEVEVKIPRKLKTTSL